MSPQRAETRLAAILAADVVGSTRLMEAEPLGATCDDAGRFYVVGRTERGALMLLLIHAGR